MDELAAEDYAKLDTNRVTARWFDGRQSLEGDQTLPPVGTNRNHQGIEVYPFKGDPS